jgi:hypothetical protein
MGRAGVVGWVCLYTCIASLLSIRPASAQGVVVDHRSLALFAQIPDAYLNAAANLAMMFVDRSVGANINEGLTCLGYAWDEAAPTSCKRINHIVPQFSSPSGEVNWSRPGGYNRSRWDFYGWPGTSIPPELPCGTDTGLWFNKLECFIRYTDANPARYRMETSTASTASRSSPTMDRQSRRHSASA